MTAPTYSAVGTKATQSTTLAKDIFGVEIKNHELIKSAYDAYQANGRANLAITKTRGLIRGGGRKPWRQKGTGRARFGSSRNPIWRGGGIVFGPTGQENYTHQLNIKAKRLALRQALTLAASDSKIKIMEDLKLKAPKTAELAKLLKKLDPSGNCLIVVESISNELSLASANIPNVMLSKASGLNVFDVLNSDCLIFTKTALKDLDQRLEAK